MTTLIGREALRIRSVETGHTYFYVPAGHCEATGSGVNAYSATVDALGKDAADQLLMIATQSEYRWEGELCLAPLCANASGEVIGYTVKF